MDRRMPTDMQTPVGYLMHQLASTTEETHQKKAVNNVAKLLIVAEATRTTIYMTLKEPEPIHIVKRLLGTLLERFGRDVAKRVDNTLHMMNFKDEKRIKNWKFAHELQLHDTSTNEEPPDSKRQRRKGPACVANLAEWADEAEKAVVTVAEGPQALAVMGDRIALHTERVDTLIAHLAKLELEGKELEQETKKQKASLLQCSTELEQRLHETPGENRQERALLKWNMKKLEDNIENMTSDARDKKDTFE